MLALGQSDFGIYSLIAGVIAMLSFVTNALVITTQRFLSYSQGQHDAERSRMVFGNSLLLHIGIGIMLLVLSVAFLSPIVNHLNIDASRVDATYWVYVIASLMMAISFWIAPFRAAFIAHENIVYLSIVDVVEGIFKLGMAIWLTHMDGVDKLVIYALIMLGIVLIAFAALGIGGLVLFKECHIPHLREWDRHFMKELSFFAGWTTYSMGCVLGRTQGFAVVLNIFFGTIANAAYGIAQQVYGAIAFISQSITNAMSPQIVAAEGRSDRTMMMHLSESLSKFATLLIATAVIPIVAEMPSILHLWLRDVPEYAVDLCRCVLIAAMVDQTTYGLNIAIQAIGDIRKFSLIVNTLKLCTLPLAYICLCLGCSFMSTIYCFVGVELLCALIRIPLLKQKAGIRVKEYIQSVFVPIIEALIIPLVASVCIVRCLSVDWRFWLSIPLLILLCVVCIYCIGLTKQERAYVRSLLNRGRGK